MCRRVPMSRFSSFGPSTSATVPVARRRHSSNWNKRIAGGGNSCEEQIRFVLRVDVIDAPAIADDFDRLAEALICSVWSAGAPIDPVATLANSAKRISLRMGGMLT